MCELEDARLSAAGRRCGTSPPQETAAIAKWPWCLEKVTPRAGSHRYDLRIDRALATTDEGAADEGVDSAASTNGPEPSGLAGAEVTARRIAGQRAPVTTLRGASVEVDARRVGSFVVALCLLALAAGASILFVAGAQKNAQVTSLRDNGVPVVVKVSGCLGLMGGSGSNLAGYACKGTFTLDGRRYDDDVPGSTFYFPGAEIRAVTVVSDPELLATPRTLAAERASGRVFLLPSFLLVVLLLLLGLVISRRTGRRRRMSWVPSPTLRERPAT